MDEPFRPHPLRDLVAVAKGISFVCAKLGATLHVAEDNQIRFVFDSYVLLLCIIIAYTILISVSFTGLVSEFAVRCRIVGEPPARVGCIRVKTIVDDCRDPRSNK